MTNGFTDDCPGVFAALAIGAPDCPEDSPPQDGSFPKLHAGTPGLCLSEVVWYG